MQSLPDGTVWADNKSSNLLFLRIFISALDFHRGKVVKGRIGYKEILEAEEIAREEALKKIAVLVRRFDLGLEDLAGLFSQTPEADDKDAYLRTAQSPTSPTRYFDPFFDAW